jgi:hypothetical protein
VAFTKYHLVGQIKEDEVTERIARMEEMRIEFSRKTGKEENVR